MRIAIIAVAAAAVITLAVITGVHFFSKTDVEEAIEDFEDQNYISAIEEFNRLIPVSDYEAAEKIYYYRARSLNGLADELEDDYSDELTEASLGKESTEDFKGSKKKIEKKLNKLNRKTGGDLTLILNRPKSSIVSRGKFYDEFVAKYRGSSLIEDLDFEQLEKIVKTQSGDKTVRSLIRFYQKYPNTSYISRIVKILFASLQKGTSSKKEDNGTIFDILLSYGRRYPTSPEINMIYTCSGDNVNLRNSPGTEGGRVGSIPKDAVLIQLEKSMDTSQIGDVRDYWYRVADLTGQRGWIFGKFLTPFDVAKYKIEEAGEKWTLDEEFADWSDSNTPAEWRHIDETSKSCISFTNSGAVHIARIEAPAETECGLFTRYNSSRAFSILCRARYLGGDSTVIFAYSLGDSNSFFLTLKNEEIDICGRSIPLHTSDWHEFRLESDDGKLATLSIDGQVTSGRIEPVSASQFPMRGIYSLYSQSGKSSFAEMQYIKAR